MSRSAAYLKLAGAGRLGEDRVRLLEAIDRHGSITAAGAEVGLTYRAAWDAVRALNNLFAAPLVTARAGGRVGGGASLTPEGQIALRSLRHIRDELAVAMTRLDRHLVDETHLEPWSHVMRTSARNALRGVISHIAEGAVNSEVSLEVSPALAIVAIISRPSVEILGLAAGKPAVALIQASDVILAAGGEAPRTSARNALAGVVAAVDEGAVNSEVVVDLAEGKTLVATITRRSAGDLDLSPGAPVTALVKASQVILAVE
jgi:molybdate transport system regulatory protein